MRSGEPSIRAVVIALAAISVANTAGAGLVLCGDAAGHASVQTHCGHDDTKKAKLRVDDLFDAQLKSAGSKLDERLFQPRHPLVLSGAWSSGAAFDHDAKWAQAQHVGAPKQNVPEPSSLALLGIGLVGAALSRRYKRT